MDSKYCVIDVETTVNNTNPNKKKCGLGSPFCDDNSIVAFGLKTANLESPVLFYRDRCVNTDGEDIIGVDGFLEENSKCPIFVGHNIAFDICHILKNTADDNKIHTIKTGILETKAVLWDTMLVEYILSGQSWKYPSLDGVCEKYGLPIKNDQIKALWNSGVKTEDIPKSMLLKYLEHDVNVTEKVFKKQMLQVEKKGLKAIIFDELRARMATLIAEHNGMAFDEELAFRLHKKLDGDIEHTCSQLLEILFEHNDITKYSKVFVDSINFGSHDQVSAMLFGGTLKWKESRMMEDKDGNLVVYKSGKNKGSIKYKNVEFTKELKGMFTARKEWKSKKTGVFYTSDEVLNELDSSRFVTLIKELREAKKERDTYLKGLTKVCWNDGLLHPTFNHVETPTGRLSCRNPNLQNITTKR
tara:strand:- start:13942 stop:15183 length:1242 start_codon:yes stop_codon:yes gene_type:complete